MLQSGLLLGSGQTGSHLAILRNYRVKRVFWVRHAFVD